MYSDAMFEVCWDLFGAKRGHRLGSRDGGIRDRDGTWAIGGQVTASVGEQLHRMRPARPLKKLMSFLNANLGSGRTPSPTPEKDPRLVDQSRHI